jgi:hypothetical protein
MSWMKVVIILTKMSISRSLLRIPALFGVLLLLFSGVREAYAFGICPMVHPGGEEVEVVEEHAHHGARSGESHHEGGSSEPGDGCDCRLLCLSVPVPTPPEPIVLSFGQPLPSEQGSAPAVEDAGLLPSLHLPHKLPFANAPPAVS